jgi:hypothetical protein
MYVADISVQTIIETATSSLTTVQEEVIRN